MEFYGAAACALRDTNPRGSFTDFSGVSSFEVSPEAIRALAARAPADPLASRPRAIVAPTAQIFGLARMFELSGDATRPNLHVVRTTREAYALLGVTEPHFEPIEQGRTR